MTALQDWLSFRPVEESIKDMVFRPLRAVLSVVDEIDANQHVELAAENDVALMRPGLERC
ncbi:MAG: hypothetical protein WCE30_20045 [Mycobacterium sp.]